MMRDGNRTRGVIVWSVLLRQLLDWRMVVNITIYISTYTVRGGSFSGIQTTALPSNGLYFGEGPIRDARRVLTFQFFCLQAKFSRLTPYRRLLLSLCQPWGTLTAAYTPFPKPKRIWPAYKLHPTLDTNLSV